MNAPCKGCTERHFKCHCECSKYKLYAKFREQVAKRKQAERAIEVEEKGQKVMEEIKKFVEIFNDFAKKEGAAIHTDGTAIWCERIKLDGHMMICVSGGQYVGSFDLKKVLPWFIADDKIFSIRVGKVEIEDV